MKPVNKKAVKDYYDIVKQPMDLETMTNKIRTRKYYSREAFLVSSSVLQNKKIMFKGTVSVISSDLRIKKGQSRCTMLPLNPLTDQG